VHRCLLLKRISFRICINIHIYMCVYTGCVNLSAGDKHVHHLDDKHHVSQWGDAETAWKFEATLTQTRHVCPSPPVPHGPASIESGKRQKRKREEAGKQATVTQKRTHPPRTPTHPGNGCSDAQALVHAGKKVVGRRAHSHTTTKVCQKRLICPKRNLYTAKRDQ